MDKRGTRPSYEPRLTEMQKRLAALMVVARQVGLSQPHSRRIGEIKDTGEVPLELAQDVALKVGEIARGAPPHHLPERDLRRERGVQGGEGLVGREEIEAAVVPP